MRGGPNWHAACLSKGTFACFSSSFGVKVFSPGKCPGFFFCYAESYACRKALRGIRPSGCQRRASALRREREKSPARNKAAKITANVLRPQDAHHGLI